MNIIKLYNECKKAFMAAASAGAVILASISDQQITHAEWLAISSALVGVYGVWKVRNIKTK